MRIVFHSNQLGERGTETALFDYCLYNEQLLGNQSIVVYPKSSVSSGAAIAKFASKFETIAYSEFAEVDQIIDRHHAGALYAIKAGHLDHVFSRTKPTMVHAVFRKKTKEIHGSAYAFVSEWLSQTCSNGLIPAVPHIVIKPEESGNLRDQLGIPSEATVFAYLGGQESFDLDFVRDKVIPKILGEANAIHFLFMNIKAFVDHPRAHFLPGSMDNNLKASFINTSDAMLHARKGGETFGLACAEFSAFNKPIIAYGKCHDKYHLNVLGDQCIQYNNSKQLIELLLGFDRKMSQTGNYRAYLEKFAPKRVMELFDRHLIFPCQTKSSIQINADIRRDCRTLKSRQRLQRCKDIVANTGRLIGNQLKSKPGP